jgi:N6-L-threonylcarbamoyladenine synthase
VGGDDSLDFSFSGLKTAAVNHIHTYRQKSGLSNDAALPEDFRMDTAASFTSAVVSGICEKLRLALSRTGMRTIVLSGGVAANSHIRRGVSDVCRDMGATLCAVPLKLCGDNGSMVGAQGYYDYLAGHRADLRLNAFAGDDI